MSHQTGIQGSDSLRQCFTKCKNGTIRLLKVSIENEQLVPACHKDANSSSWDKVYDSLVLPLIEDGQPCYILFRLDTKNSSGFEWLLISWCPDDSHVRQKMLYSSTKATLKTEFGSAQIAEELHGTIKSDVNLEGYFRHKQSRSSPGPLTSREEEQQVIKGDVKTDISVDSKQQTIGGLNFLIQPAVKEAVLQMVRGSYDYLQLAIDLEKEEIYLVTADKISIEKLPTKFPQQNARYHVYNFKHTHEGDYMESFVFIYSMPGYSCSIKERTLYSASKGALIDSLSSWGLELTKKLEIDDASELTEKYLYDEIHPIVNINRTGFQRPKPPASRGPKRMTKSRDT